MTSRTSNDKAPPAVVILRNRKVAKDLRTDLTAVLNEVRRLRLAKSRLRRVYPKGISSLCPGTRLHSAVALVFDFVSLRMTHIFVSFKLND